MADIGIDQKDSYFVAVKIFLEKDGTFLILKDKFGEWDLPGGRIKKQEFEKPLNEIIYRKMIEEVEDLINYTVEGKPEVLMRHERVEMVPGNPTIHIFGLGYRAHLVSGDINLSEAHTEMKWVKLADFKPEEYFKGGWLKGVQEYLILRRAE